MNYMQRFNSPRLKRSLLAFSLFYFVLLFSIDWSQAQIIPADRRTTWEGNVGVPGGIKNRTKICKEFSPGVDGTVITDAIRLNCNSGDVVLLRAGNYNLTQPIIITKSGITLRGEGMETTHLTLQPTHGEPVIWVVGPYDDDWAKPNPQNHVKVTANSQQGSTVIEVSDKNEAGAPVTAPNGRLVFLDRLNDVDVQPQGAYGVNVGAYTSLAYPGTGQDRLQNQISKVVNVSGRNVTLDPPIHMANFTGGTPHIWWESGNPVEYVGVEDLWVTDPAAGIVYQNTYGSWAKNVKVTASRYGLKLLLVVRSEFRGCLLKDPSSDDDYPLSVFYTGGSLFEDNIFTNNLNSIVMETSSGNVFAYNYVSHTLSPLQWMRSSVAIHGGHPTMNLFEGNIFTQVSADNGWGSSERQTFLRNRLTGVDEDQPNVNNYVGALIAGANNRNFNVVGNILGTPGKNTLYETDVETSNAVYMLGWGGNIPGGGKVPNDSKASTSMLRHGNWTSALTPGLTGLLWDSKIVDQNIPNSYYLSSKPSFFGDLQWPPFDPRNPTLVDPARIPAGYRFINGRNPPNGGAPNPPSALKIN